HLHGLPEAHVVGQAAAEAVARQELEPAQALALVRAQLAAETGRLAARDEALEVGQALPLLGPLALGLLVGELREQVLDEPRLAGAEAQLAAAHLAELQRRSPARHPVVGQDAGRAVAEAHGRVAALQRREQRRELARADALEAALDLEPVHAARGAAGTAARERDARRREGAVARALALDDPALRA